MFQHINELQLKMNITKVLKNAEAIFLQVKQIETKLPKNMRRIISSDPVEAKSAQNGSTGKIIGFYSTFYYVIFP